MITLSLQSDHNCFCRNDDGLQIAASSDGNGDNVNVKDDREDANDDTYSVTKMTVGISELFQTNSLRSIQNLKNSASHSKQEVTNRCDRFRCAQKGKWLNTDVTYTML